MSNDQYRLINEELFAQAVDALLGELGDCGEWNRAAAALDAALDVLCEADNMPEKEV